MNWFKDNAVGIALVCSLVAIAYGLYLTQWLLKLSPGNERMQEISRAVQEGAAAYLKKQYTTIAFVAIVPFLLLGFYNELGWGTAIGFLIGARPLLRCGLHRHERRRALERADGRGGTRRARSRARGRVQGRLRDRAARRRARPVRRRRILLGAHRLARPHAFVRHPRPDRPRVRRLADLGLRATRRRHLHEGRRRRRRPGGEDRGRHPRGRPAQPRGDRGQRRRQRRRLRGHGGRPVRDVCRHRGRRDAARRPPGRAAAVRCTRSRSAVSPSSPPS